MELKELLSLLSGVFSFSAYLPYVRELLKEDSQVRPNRASWFVWWVIDISTVAALIATGEYAAIPMFAAFSFGSTVVLILSIRRGEGGFTKRDMTCVGIALAGVGLWAASGNPTLAIISLMIAAIAGTYPTIAKAWKEPASEDGLTWALFATGGLLGVMAAEDWGFVAIAPQLNVWILQVNILLPLVQSRFVRLAGW